MLDFVPPPRPNHPQLSVLRTQPYFPGSKSRSQTQNTHKILAM